MSDETKPIPNPSSTFWTQNQKLRYLIIGGWNTIVGYTIFAGIYLLIGQHVSYMLIAVISHIAAVSQSYITQRWVVFRSTQHWRTEYLRFHIAHLGSLTMGLITLPLLIELFKVPPLIAQALITALTVVASYFVHRHFTFKQARDA